MNKQFYKTTAWRKCRDAFFIFKQGLCERCSEPGKIVHHKVYLTEENMHDPEVTLSFASMCYLSSA
ncbi:5-methylcytosine-specific restriction endonuclease McrA [Croceifilum oryzae]|uniref:5-methylcytosine-specific restriction endonuclease McrA n=1 Tax=Croceifilum oryzae TaxID=1553429 RepID=A0AAJ1TJR6_9BACL|nr:5-methylcytosine-specific restriction endonuclease McrA [Croceifilum oryzae]